MVPGAAGGSRRAAAIGLLAAATLLCGCGPQAATPPAAVAVAATAFPAGCGPRPVRQPPAASIPASPAPPGQPLPIYGAAVGDHSLTAAGGTLAVWAGTTAASPDPLYVSTDAGLHWAHLPKPEPPVDGSLDPLVLSAGGRLLAGADGQDLYVLRLPAAGSAAPAAWLSRPVQNLSALAFDPADSNLLAGLGAQSGSGRVLLYVSSSGARTLTARPLPATIGHGEALVVTGGAALAAIGQAAGPARLFSVPLAGGTAPAPPQPPAAAASPVFSLAVGPAGTLYLATGGGLFALPPRAAAWTQIPLPAGLRGEALVYIAATASQLYVAADDASDQGRLWRGPKTGGGWRQVEMPPGFIGQPVPDGTRVWVPSDVGPVLVGPGGTGDVRADGIAAPASVVASAAWRPTQVAAGWSGGLFFSADGGRTWTERTPPGSPLTGFAQLAWTPDGGCIAAIRAAAGPSRPRAYLSGDGGRTWWAVPAPGAGWVTALTESPPGSGVWWLAETGTTPGLYRSAPGRAAWTRVGLPAAAPAPLHVAPAPGGVWWSGLSFGAWRIRLAPAARGPALWWARLTRRRAPPPSITASLGAGADRYQTVTAHPLASDPYDPAVVYNGLRRSVDGGGTWQAVQPGTSGVLPGLTAVQALAFGPRHPGALLATPAELLRDDGTAWVPVWRTAPGNRITAVAPAGPGLFYAAVEGLGVIVVADPRAAWQAPPAPAGQGRWITPAAGSGPPPLEVAAPSAPATVYRLSTDGTLAVSQDGGGSFPTVHRVALTGGVSCCTPAEAVGMGRVAASVLAVSPVDPSRLYVGMAIQGVAQGQLGLWTSADGGLTWERSGLPPTLSVQDLAAVPGSAGTLYAVAYTGSDSGAAGLWRSADGGRTWTPVSGLTGPVYSVATPSSTEVLVGGAGRVWRSTDAGRTFAPLPLGIPLWRAAGAAPGGLPVLAVLRGADGTLFAATGFGLARSRDAGRTWQVVSEPVGDPPVLPGGLSLQADGSVAVATQFGRFVYRAAGGSSG